MKTFEQIRKESSIYRNRENAFSALGHTDGGYAVMLGDNGEYWLTTLANWNRLSIYLSSAKYLYRA